MVRKLIGLLLMIIALAGWQTAEAQTYDVNWNINTQGDLTIPSSSTLSYRIFGSNTGASSDTTFNKVIIQTGYQGTIMLDNVKMKTNPAMSTTANGYSPITVLGTFNQSNLSPLTKVKIVLSGENTLKVDNNVFYPALRVDQGAQIHLCAVDSLDDTSGKLYAYAYNSESVQGGAAAIGGGFNDGGGILNSSYDFITPTDPFQQGSVLNSFYRADGTQVTTSNMSGMERDFLRASSAGGNIIISSGTIVAMGSYHGAGIGSGWRTWFMGNIAIYGGDVTSSGGIHAAGIGSGCPFGIGAVESYAPTSSIIVLPPARINPSSSSDQGLSGAKSITYIGDPRSPLVTVRTVDNETYADIYADITETQSVVLVFDSLGIDLDLSRVKFGSTADSANYKFRGVLEQNTTFFTDKSSTNPGEYYGRPYQPVTTTVPRSPMTKEIVLPLTTAKMVIEGFPSQPLAVGYNSTEAYNNAYRIKVTYNDPIPMTGITYELQNSAASGFGALSFLAADGSTPIATPTSLSAGTVFYVVAPLGTGKPIGIYDDVFRFNGTWNGGPTGWIRHVVEQRVALDDTGTNNYIRVTASPSSGTILNPSTYTVGLSLRITHSGLSSPYDPSDVYAKYIITTEANYEAALAATPLNQWKNLNIPASGGAWTPTTASFTGVSSGTYYIHWYVTSGLVLAHSENVTAPPKTYGGFGPYQYSSSIQVSVNPHIMGRYGN